MPRHPEPELLALGDLACVEFSHFLWHGPQNNLDLPARHAMTVRLVCFAVFEQPAQRKCFSGGCRKSPRSHLAAKKTTTARIAMATIWWVLSGKPSMEPNDRPHRRTGREAGWPSAAAPCWGIPTNSDRKSKEYSCLRDRRACCRLI